ncbi:Cti6 protein [Pichia kluyveri]|uniref:Cti6 protein n=1 Tax=Pichia kluyveri TaxID=36015 RepID=A0AAV5R1A6_PICKL|nr:Cti6 protein [Pichia kluyveri]
MSSRRSRRSTNHPKYSEEYTELDFNDPVVDSKQSVTTTRGNKSKSESSRNANILEDEGDALIDEEDADEEEEEEEEITRCICGSIDLQIPKKSNSDFQNVDPGFFIQCEKCSVWQHGYCVGIKDEDNAPEKYWCEQCKPQFHTLFTDKFNTRRSKYDPLNPHDNHHDNHRRGIKRKNGRFVKEEDNILNDDNKNSNIVKNESDNLSNNEENKSINNTSADQSIDSKDNDANISKNNNEDDDHDDGHKRKHRRRSSYLSYAEQLKQALLESAKEANVTPDDVNISASDGPEVFERDLRRNLRTKSNFDTENNTNNNNVETNETDGNSDSNVKNDTNKKSNKRFKSSRSTSNDENQDLDDNNVKEKETSPHTSNKRDLKRSVQKKPNQKKEFKSTNKIQVDKSDDKPFRANIPSARINLNEMTRRIFSIMDFVSNIQLNLSNEEEFKNNLFKMNNDELSPDVLVLKNSLTDCYNDSVSQLDTLTKLLNDWQNDHI